MAKAWYQYQFDSNFGTYPDPLPGANYPKPDANFYGVPDGTPITALAAGTVTGARAQPWGPEAYSITVKLDKPLNSVATHMAYNYVSKPAVHVGQHVTAGTTLAISGNPYDIGVAFALIDTDVYGTGSRNEPFSGTYVNPDLSPVAFLQSIQGVNVSDITLGEWCDATLDQLRSSQGISNLLGAQPSQNIKNFFVAWAHVEGGSQTNQCHFNPLNTMQDETGATQCSGAMPGIKAYPDSQTGTNATLDALANGNYGALLNALVTNDEKNLGFSGNQMASNVAQDLSVWVSGRRNPIQASYIYKIMADAGISNASINGANIDSGLPGASQDQINKWRSIVIGQGAAPTDQVPPFQDPTGGALASIGNFFQALQGFFSNPVRLIKILGGTAMIIVGLVLLARSLVPGVSIGGTK